MPSDDGEGFDGRIDVVVGVGSRHLGANAGLPAQWLIYVTVDDLKSSIDKTVSLGGEVLHGPRPMGGGELCVIRDPAGAMLALVSS